MTVRPSPGGAAAAGGMDFQHRVAAWVAARVLAETSATPPWDLPVQTSLEWFRCETEQPVDDLLIKTSGGGFVFAQVKRTLDLSSRPDSALASALGQFVRQVAAARSPSRGGLLDNRPLDPAKDRLVLITSSRSSQAIRHHLPSVLRKLRTPGQPLDHMATNNEERRALSVIREHIRRSWQVFLNGEPSEEELRQLLSLIHVHVLDVEAGGTGEREAKNLLRSEVLRGTDKTDQVWATLITLCASYASEHSGADRPTLQRKLLDAGFDLKAPRSYEEDIEKLQEYSQQTLNALAHLARMRVGSTPIKVRRECTEALTQVAEEGSVLVVGEPGAGKSGALHGFVEALQEAGRDYVFLAVDRLGARSLGELRDELALENDLVEVLDNWPGLRPAFLIVDALDAARAEPTGAAIRDIIRQVVEKHGRWRVVASIRKFDLRYGLEFQQHFAGCPPTQFLDPEFQRVRHLNVPRFSEDELSQISAQSPPLRDLIARAPAELRDLLRVPFNLRLMAELLGEGITLEELTPVKTQLELLDRYWRYRVVRSDDQGDGREAILRELCTQMVSARMLRADRSAVARPDTSTLLTDLLSSQVLTEWQASPQAQPDRYVLAFSHHVLFDYAVERLLLRGDGGDGEKVVRMLGEEPDLVMVVRPSLVLHFRPLWNISHDREGFWDLAFRMIRAREIPEVGKLVALAVAAELARTMADLEPLCAALEAGEPDKQDAAEKALRHVVGALLASTPEEMPLAGPTAGPWCDLLERVSRMLRPSTAYTVRPLLATLCERREDLTPEQLDNAGKAARRLLEFAWSQAKRDPWLVVHALRSVCWTFQGDPAASTFLIRRCLEPSHLSRFGFEEMPWLAREVERLIGSDLRLVEEIYRAAFAHREESEEPTPMGSGHILSLVSNRRQDYHMALYELARVFPQFLSSAPEGATRALMAVIESYVVQRHSMGSDKWQEELFDFDGRQARLRPDYSHIWDEWSTYQHDEPLKMLNAFQGFLEDLATQKDGRDKLRGLIQIVVSENRLAVVWRRLLVAGSRFPETLGKEILPLAWSIPVLATEDTTVPAGDYLKAIFPILEPALRQRIELTILSIPDAMPADGREAAERVRDRLLGCLALGAIVTNEVRTRLEDLKARKAIPPNELLVRFEGWRGRPYGEEEYLREKGVPIQSKPNQTIRELERPLKDFADKHLNSAPTLEEAQSILPALRDLHEALTRAEADGVHPKQRDYAWGNIAAACERIARTEGLPCDQELGAFVKAILLEASRNAEPVHDPQYDAQFDEHPSWGSPAPRIEAAAGLITLARHDVAPDVLRVVEELSGDPVPAVRDQIAARLDVLYRTAPDLMWRIIERMSREEGSRGVLQGLLSGSLMSLAGVESDRVAALTKTIFERVSDGPGASRVRGSCVGLLSDLYIWRDHPLAWDVVQEITSHPASYTAEAGYVLGRLREPATYGPTDHCDPQADAVRSRALDLLARLVRPARSSLQELEGRYVGIGFNDWSQSDQQAAESLSHLMGSIGLEVYFAAGAFDTESQRQPARLREVSPQSRRFYREAGAILDELAEVAIPCVAYHLLETLEHFVPVDPRGVFLRVRRAVLAGQEAGLQYESLAADVVVRLVERYLAEHREVFQQDDDCRKALIEILDAFVDAGWPSAQRLTYRLEEIFR